MQTHPAQWVGLKALGRGLGVGGRKKKKAKNAKEKGEGPDRGREKRFVRFPLPPNRTGGSPTSGSPVDGLTPKGIDEQFHGRLTD